jgi:phage gpG-like protein
MSFAIEVDVSDLDAAMKKLRPIFDFAPGDLMSTLGAIGESQTRRRISEEKTSPSGEAWPPNLKGTPILVETGQHLLYSIAFTSNDEEAEWGATWEHAHVHQNGMTITPKNAKALAVPLAAFGKGDGIAMAKSVTIPARPFIGLSADNITEMVDIVSDSFGLAQ